MALRRAGWHKGGQTRRPCTGNNNTESKRQEKSLFVYYRSAITIFPAVQSGVTCRIWNPQFIQYAGYETPAGIKGDPSNVELTKIAFALGWQPMKRTRLVLTL